MPLEGAIHPGWERVWLTQRHEMLGVLDLELGMGSETWGLVLLILGPG